MFDSYRQHQARVIQAGLYQHTFCNSQNLYSGVEKLVSRRAHNPETAGPNPAPATNNMFFNEHI